MHLRRALSQTTLFCLAVVVSIGSLPIAAQNTSAKKKAANPDRIYKQWVDEEVRWIITPEERSAFMKLTTDDERDTFIEQFWRRRDPDPDTPENEYRDEYYRRVAYADAKFASGVPGRNTDRGRIYIVFGPPDSTDSHPAGGQYQRPTNEGGGSTSTFPFEVWFYRHLDNVSDGIEIEFVDPTMSGEYHIARGPDEKDALLMVPGAGETLSEQLHLSSKVDRVAYGGMGGSYVDPLFGQSSKDNEFTRMELIRDLSKPPTIAGRSVFGGGVDPVLVESEVLPVAFRADYRRVDESSVITSFSLLIENQDIALANKGGIYQGQVNVSGRITPIAGKRPRFFQQSIETGRYTARDVSTAQQTKSIYQMNVVLEPGRYKIDLVAQDTNSGRMGVITQSFVVPQYRPNELSTSSVIVASDITKLDGIATGQFVIGRYKVHPNMTQTFKPGAPVGVFLQIYSAQVDQYTLMPNVDVSYVVSREGQEVTRIVEDGKTGTKDIDGRRLVVGRMLGLKLEPGTYQLGVTITDKVAGNTINTAPALFIIK